MLGFVLFGAIAIAVPLTTCSPATRYFKLRDDVIYIVDAPRNNGSCTDSEARRWSYDFHSCFIDRKYSDGGMDLNNIVDRILEHSRDCVTNTSMNCKPNYRGFLVIMDKVIEQVKDYSRLYLDDINHGREKIKDLDCVETSLSNKTYASCFESAFESNATDFSRRVKGAFSCTNKSNKLCSRRAKSSLNAMVRTILGVKQPETENIEEHVLTTPAPKKWYEYIFQPFISIWNFIRSFFG